MKKLTVLALASLLLAACSSAEKEAQRAQGFSYSERSLDVAQRNATVACRDAAQCDAMWALTKRYIEENSNQPVIRADAVAIETDVPSRSGKPVYSATRVAKGNGATIALYAQCRGMYGPERARGSDYDDCASKIIAAQNRFATYLRSAQ
ncbi:hypothetical protein [Caballeronia sp. M1242]|uniref:hypothetical protein n=1 Tax=Caballeronia sp. M1242 TaxID=2814653 RepID=UPI0019D1CD69|nr:hypothetical protein [Caballeronia sp. M1242]QSN60664.1 hypothetical protein JYK05_09915 [Caballeronia sp. M1242]